MLVIAVSILKLDAGRRVELRSVELMRLSGSPDLPAQIGGITNFSRTSYVSTEKNNWHCPAYDTLDPLVKIVSLPFDSELGGGDRT